MVRPADESTHLLKTCHASRRYVFYQECPQVTFIIRVEKARTCQINRLGDAGDVMARSVLGNFFQNLSMHERCGWLIEMTRLVISLSNLLNNTFVILEKSHLDLAYAPARGWFEDAELSFS